MDIKNFIFYIFILMTSILFILITSCALFQTTQVKGRSSNEETESLEEPLKHVSDFPQNLRRDQPLTDINDAIVYTVNEAIYSDYGISLVGKVGSDVLIRGWFKWGDSWDTIEHYTNPNHRHYVQMAHDLGALFGGGLTCSAIYNGENNLVEEQVLDMATRDPNGELVDAWGQQGVRHGTLSNPAYLKYLLMWCQFQIDAGVDYLFMDEINAALHENEGFDDYSIQDFRDYLIRTYCEDKGWARDDKCWKKVFKVNLNDTSVCPDGTIASFDYRMYLKKYGLVRNPLAKTNKLLDDWGAFRLDRDDRAWKWLIDSIRDYAASKGCHVFISANGLAPYVDLQVLGIWDMWRVRGDSIDLSKSQIEDWATIVIKGQEIAKKRVPVIFFHDWGFGGFQWMQVSPVERKLWMRVRGAEIYAAGGYFAFPILGPYGNNALHDGTIKEVARQTAFYQQYKSLYLEARLVGFKLVESSESLLSIALWRRENPPALILHAINRRAKGGKPTQRVNVTVKVHTVDMPRIARIVSPDWTNERQGEFSTDGRYLFVTLPQLEAYAITILEYDSLPELIITESQK